MKFIFTFLIIFHYFSVTIAEPLSCENHSPGPNLLPRKVSENTGQFISVYDERLGETIYKFVERNEAPANVMESARDQLAKIVNKLKSFLLDETFDYEKFETAADLLEVELANITTMVEKQEVEQTSIKSQLKFTKTMFQDMVESIEPLKHFVIRNDYKLLGQLIDFNVRLYNMYTSRGSLDRSIKGYGDIIFRHGIMSSFWEKEFFALPNIPIGVRSAFKTQLSKTELTLGNLRLQLS